MCYTHAYIMRRWKGVHLTAEWRTNSSSLMVTKSHMLVILPSITNSTKTYVYTNISLRSVAVAIGVECSSEPSFCHRTTYEWSKSESYNAVPYAYVSVMSVLYVQDWQRGCLFIMIHFDMDHNASSTRQPVEKTRRFAAYNAWDCV